MGAGAETGAGSLAAGAAASESAAAAGGACSLREQPVAYTQSTNTVEAARIFMETSLLPRAPLPQAGRCPRRRLLRRFRRLGLDLDVLVARGLLAGFCL